MIWDEKGCMLQMVLRRWLLSPGDNAGPLVLCLNVYIFFLIFSVVLFFLQLACKINFFLLEIFFLHYFYQLSVQMIQIDTSYSLLVFLEVTREHNVEVLGPLEVVAAAVGLFQVFRIKIHDETHPIGIRLHELIGARRLDGPEDV